MTIHVLDDYYLAITLLITIAYQLFFFSIAFTFKFDKVTDFAGGTNFALLAIITLSFSGKHNARNILTSIFLIIWALRLSGFLLFRIFKTGKDDRFDDKRTKFFPFLGFWIFQMLWVWIISLPVTVLNSPNVLKYPQHNFGTGRDVVGVVGWTAGLVIESMSDVQRYIYRSKSQGGSDSGTGRPICDKGFWAWSRHPNYFGEIIVQFYRIAHSSTPANVILLGLYTLAIYMLAVTPAANGHVSGQAYKALYATILGPFFLTALLLFVSGLPLSERPSAKKRYEKNDNWEQYTRYLDRTSILIPLPPAVYEKLPWWLKRTVLLEWPIYVFDPAKHADKHSRPGHPESHHAGEEEQSTSDRALDAGS